MGKFHRNKPLLKSWNITILTLILKVQGAIELKYFILSKCNTIYKIVTKLLANRLREILLQIILAKKNNFVKER